MEKITIKKNSKIVYKADGYRDLADHATKHRDAKGASSKPKSGYYSDFYATKSFGDASHLMVDGWDGPLAKITQIRESVRQRIGSVDTQVFRFDNNYVGGYLDVDTYLSGDPACMLQAYEHPDKRKTKFVRILVDTTFSAFVDAKDIQTRGAAVVALCDTLNLCGYTTEVWACMQNGGQDGRNELTVLLPVQRVGEPWDVRSAFFPLAHGDYLRRVMFGVMESMTKDEREVFGAHDGRGYGQVIGTKKGDQADLHCGGADVIVSSQRGDIDKIVADPIKWVLSQCKNLGVLGEDEI